MSTQPSIKENPQEVDTSSVLMSYALYTISSLYECGLSRSSHPGLAAQKIVTIAEGIEALLEDERFTDPEREHILASAFRHLDTLYPKMHFYLLWQLAHADRPPREDILPHPVALAYIVKELEENRFEIKQDIFEQRLSRDNLFQLLLRLLSSPELPEETARSFCESLTSEEWLKVLHPNALWQVVLVSPHCPVPIVVSAASSKDSSIRQSAVKNPNCPEDSRIIAALMP